ncbi:MAG: hypothetical protein IKY63_01895 [Tidjanibacter sp.]|nr:hypothetical protein [Tidjanibacter sp.]
MKRIGKLLLITLLAIGATSCEVVLPLLVVGTTAVGSAGAIYLAATSGANIDQQVTASDSNGKVVNVIKSGAHTIVTDSEGGTTTVIDHGAHKIVTHSDGSSSTIIDHGAHKIIHNSDGTSATVADHGAHKVVTDSNGNTRIVVVH